MYAKEAPTARVSEEKGGPLRKRDKVVS